MEEDSAFRVGTILGVPVGAMCFGIATLISGDVGWGAVATLILMIIMVIMHKNWDK